MKLKSTCPLTESSGKDTSRVDSSASVSEGKDVESNGAKTKSDGRHRELVDVLHGSDKVLLGVGAEHLARAGNSNIVNQDKDKRANELNGKSLPRVNAVIELDSTYIQ